MRSVFISAHLDDAVLSCGGLIYDMVKAGKEVEVWTVIASPEKYPVRIQEDESAMKQLGIKFIHFTYFDAIDRYGLDGIKVYGTVFSPILEEGIVSMVQADIGMNLKSDDELYCPLAVGEHVDHSIVRQACEGLNRPLTYYTDFPYIDYLPNALNKATDNLCASRVLVSAVGLINWLNAVAEYKSQKLYETIDLTQSKIVDYWKIICGIFLWKRIDYESNPR
jgi:hypothetical protein